MGRRVFGQDSYDTFKEREMDFPREPFAEAKASVIRVRPKSCECGHSRALHVVSGVCVMCDCRKLRVFP